MISDFQSAFLGQRHMHDGALVLNEVVDFANRKKKEFILVKVGFLKA